MHFQILHLVLSNGSENQISSPSYYKNLPMALTLSHINGDTVLHYVKEKLISMPYNSVPHLWIQYVSVYLNVLKLTSHNVLLS